MLRFLVGLFSLILGGELLVRYLAVIGDTLGIRRAFIGLVIVAFGTSLPEFFVSLVANLKGLPSVALGNVFGSYMANIGLALGISSLIRPLKVEEGMARKDIPMMFIALMLILALSFDGALSRLDGLIILSLFAVSIMKIKVVDDGEERRSVTGRSFVHMFLIVLGFFMLVWGSDLMVQGAKEISERWRIAQVIIGSTLVAVGTSIPELATTIIASRKGEAEIALGNVVGSNIFNMLFILGVVSMVRPLPVDRRFVELFFPFMVGLSIPLLLKSRGGGIIGRGTGWAFLAIYAFFVYLL